MKRKDYFLVGLVAVLGGLYAFYFTDWFAHKSIRIEHTVRSVQGGWPTVGRPVNPTVKPVNNVTFSLHKDYKLTSVKVMLAADARTNQYAHPLWHLTSKQGSQPANSLAYAEPVNGMTPATPGVGPEPLEPGTEYRLVVEAGSVKGEHDFQITTQGR
ncbi:MAG: hypothetical protein ABIP71_00770 [Verrucomicrobiota bacterium]